MTAQDRDYEDRITRVIEDYVEPNAHVLAMERIHRNFSGESVNFSSFDEAINYYTDYEWSAEEVRNFISVCKTVVEGGQGRLSECYFKIVSNDRIHQKDIENELQRKKYRPEAKGEAKEGFQWDVGTDFINGRYVYVDVDTHISYNGEIDELVTESSVEFRIDIEENILILESTSVIDVQKIKSIFSKRTDLDIRVLFDPSRINSRNSRQIFVGFLDAIESGALEATSVLEINEVTLRRSGRNQPSDEEAVKKITIEGKEIFESQEVRDHLNQGWHLGRISAKIMYSDNVFRLTVAGSSVMSYAKITEFSNRNKARELMDVVRLEYYRMAEQFRMGDRQ